MFSYSNDALFMIIFSRNNDVFLFSCCNNEMLMEICFCLSPVAERCFCMSHTGLFVHVLTKVIDCVFRRFVRAFSYHCDFLFLPHCESLWFLTQNTIKLPTASAANTSTSQTVGLSTVTHTKILTVRLNTCWMVS